MTTYSLEMRQDGGVSETREITADTLDEALSQVADECDEWAHDGDWGEDGASVETCWTLTDEEGEEIESGCHTTDIEPNHAGLILTACGGKHDDRWERCCGDDPDDHDWTSEGEGGCDDNPGVWSTGGTSMLFRSHCRVCGLSRSEHSTGSQRNPGECDSTSYEMPETWCAECEREECECDVEDDE